MLLKLCAAIYLRAQACGIWKVASPQKESLDPYPDTHCSVKAKKRDCMGKVLELLNQRKNFRSL